MLGQSIRVILLSFLLVPIYCSAYGGFDDYITDGNIVLLMRHYSVLLLFCS